MKLLKVSGILWILAAVYVLAYLAPLACRPMLRPDEYRYAEIPREMIETGDWVTPKMLGIRYFEKPAPGYQLTAVSFSLFGENAFALRLPSALASLLTAALIFLLARAISRDRAFAFLSAGIFLTFGLVFGVGTFAVLDMQLTAALTGAVVFGFLAWHNRKAFWKEAAFLICAGVFAGFGFLIKGGLGVVVPAIVLVPFLMLRREWKRIFIYGVTALGAAALVALPWSLAIHEAEPDFWRYFLEEEHWKRFTSATYDRKPQPFWYFIMRKFTGPAAYRPSVSGRRREMNSVSDTRRCFLLLLIFAALISFTGLACREIASGDESRVAGISAEMFLESDYLVPRLNGRPFLTAAVMVFAVVLLILAPGWLRVYPLLALVAGALSLLPRMRGSSALALFLASLALTFTSIDAGIFARRNAKTSLRPLFEYCLEQEAQGKKVYILSRVERLEGGAYYYMHRNMPVRRKGDSFDAERELWIIRDKKLKTGKAFGDSFFVVSPSAELLEKYSD